MYNTPGVGGSGPNRGSAGSRPVPGVMRTPELNQVSQMMSSMNVGAVGDGMNGALGTQVREQDYEHWFKVVMHRLDWLVLAKEYTRKAMESWIVVNGTGL